MTTSRHRYLAAQDISVVFEDDVLLVVAKPSGLLVLPDRYDKERPNVYQCCLQEFGEMFMVHRIDKETSGILLIAKTAEAHAALNASFQNREVQKTYLALSKGAAAEPEGIVEVPLREHSGRRAMMVADEKHGKPSITRYRVLERFRGFSWVEARPVTGRTHQVRVHLREIGLPLVGDPLYGDGAPLLLSGIKKNYRGKEEEKPLIDRTALHAFSLVFEHPLTRRQLSCEAPLPKDMKAALQRLRKYSPWSG